MTEKRLKRLVAGVVLLILFLAIFCISMVVLLTNDYTIGQMIFRIVGIGLVELIIFWTGILYIYLTSVQLGIKWRIIGLICGWIPIVHMVVLCIMIGIVIREYRMESTKRKLNQKRKGMQICKTKYPIVLIHGVFFRDTKFFNYWGRIPGELEQNGATIFYGEQQSATSVAESAKELAVKIRSVVESTGCEKVNLIAHSKGGLDSRYAISQLGIAPLVASLTTINTPHRGCIFAEYLIHKAPQGLKDKLSNTYNQALRKLGDKEPDFMSAVMDLTDENCRKMNELVHDEDGVFYQSVGSKMQRARGGKFPLNLSYPLVKHFDGANDGLVSVESASWGECFHPINISQLPEDGTGGKCKRGVSHADVIDLNRENIKGFDVREYYVKLVSDLKNRGF